MFVDKVQIKVEAGDGGNGYVSFRQEKFIDRGGPDGGDGGNGGSVILRASRNQNTLANFRYQKVLKAEDGKPGFNQRKHGKSGEDLLVDVPVGTIVLSESGTEIIDLTEDQQSFVVAKGGKGGFGNAHFVSSVRQAPKVAEKGERGESLAALLELRMIADVGLVGLPNAGKSTLLSVTSNARPEIAAYPFTTLTPNLGVVDIEGKPSLLLADIPGLIEGASKGKGLGDEFLRHIERTNVILHLIDIYQDDLVTAYRTIQKELKEYRVDMSKRPQIVVLTKIEGLDDDIVADRLKELKKSAKGVKIMAISAQSKKGLKELLYEISHEVEAERSRAKEQEREKPDPSITIYKLRPDETKWRVSQHGTEYTVTGRKIEKFAAKTDFDDEYGVQRIRDIMRKTGILRELERRGIVDGNKIIIGTYGDLTY